MAKIKGKGLARAREIYQERDKRARELKAEGKKIMGYLCIYPPVEMLTALDLVPYRLFGDMREPITEADKFMGMVVCPFLRSTLDLGLKGRYDFLEGTVFAHTCDTSCGFARVWRHSVDLPYTHFIEMPHAAREAALGQQKALLKDLQKTLESFTGKKITPARFKKAIEAHNQQRALVRELYELKKPDPPLISGVETLQVLKAVMSLPVDEGSQLLREVINEVKNRKDGPPKKAGRLLVWGPVIDDTALIETIESLDANVVIDDTCVGTRAYFADVKLTDDPLDGLAYYHLRELKCPKTFVASAYDATRKDHMADLERRFSYLGDYAKDWKANGVILESMSYCDTHGYEVPSVKDYLDHVGFPSVYIEHDHSEAALAPIRTRVQGFLEVIAG